jgi:hypothetical protein
MTQVLLLLFMRFPLLGGLFGLVFSAAFSITGIMSWYDLQSLPPAPLPMTLQQATATLQHRDFVWVDLTDVQWDCANIVSRQVGNSVRTEIFFTNTPQTILGVAEFSATSAYTCTQIQGKQAVGFLQVATPTFLQRLPSRGFNLSPYTHIVKHVTLCTFCSRTNSLMLVVLSIVFVPLGLSMYPLCRRLQYDF